MEYLAGAEYPISLLYAIRLGGTDVAGTREVGKGCGTRLGGRLRSTSAIPIRATLAETV